MGTGNATIQYQGPDSSSLLFFVSSAELGDIFASIGVRELQPNASEAFAVFSDAHRWATEK